MILSWNTTKRCNLYCKHCYRESDDHKAENELTTEEGFQLIEQIKATGKFKILILSGGEPLLRKDLEELAAHAKGQGLIPVLGTNGTLLTKERAKSLKKAGIAAVGISIDAVNREQHDAFRQRDGAFDKAIEGIKNAIDVGLRVQINPTITKDNVNDLEKFITLARELGATAVHPFFLVEAGRGKCLSDNALSDQNYFEALETVMDLQKTSDIELKPTCAPQFMSIAKEMDMPLRFTRGCLAGISYCCILPNGDVHVCPYLPLEAGNVRTESFETIWASSPIFLKLRDKEEYKGNCGTCSHHSICGGCRARAYYKTGDFLDQDPMSSHCFKQSRCADE